tara:strand:- start:297 stop:410 length:114 start_codon:yes stop_codon:yes gene_type:complete
MDRSVTKQTQKKQKKQKKVDLLFFIGTNSHFIETKKI